MTTPPPVNLAPVWQLLLVGALLASTALAWLWLRRHKDLRSDWLLRLTLLTLVLTFDLVVFGAFTRLTDSGLGCPDWPGCYGNASPIGAKAAIGAAQAVMPDGPVTHGKAWIEMLHRYLATGVGALILIVALTHWRLRLRRTGGNTPPGVFWATASLLWVALQGAFGALTVTMKLFPAVVTLHLLGGMGLLALLTAQAEQLGRSTASRPPMRLDRVTRGLLVAACVLLTIQIALGGWVSTNYAVLACTDFPMCQNSWWPDMRFDQAFQIWRGLGLTREGDSISLAALTAIHVMHRSAGVLVVAVMALLAWRLYAVDAFRSHARGIAALGVLQFASGLANVVLGWPLLAALLHTAGAAALVLLLTWCLRASRSESPAASTARPSVLDFSA